MARLQCVRPGCSKEVDTPDTAQAIELLKIHDAKAHSIAIKPEKPRRPELATAGGAGLGGVLFSNGRAISSQTELDAGPVTKHEEELLTKDNLTLDVAEKMAVVKESAKYSQAAMWGEGISG